MKHKMIKALCLTMILMLAAMPVLAESATVNASARIYRLPSTSSESVKLAKVTTVTVIATAEGWAQVKYKGVTGYVPERDLTAAAMRVAAYVNRDTYVYAGASTSSAKRAVSVNTKVYVVGAAGSFCEVQNASGSVNCYILKSHLSADKVSRTQSGGDASWKSQVVRMNWFEGGSEVLRRGSYGYIYDIDTGTVVHIKRMGGTNHADCEPASRSDTAKLLKIAGGSFSWESHAVILYAGGKFVACGINTKPHGDQTITTNGYNGQFCLHMTGSITHGSEEVNADHQASVNRAYNWAH